jgi:hypothetical protein
VKGNLSGNAGIRASEFNSPSSRGAGPGSAKRFDPTLEPEGLQWAGAEKVLPCRWETPLVLYSSPSCMASSTFARQSTTCSISSSDNGSLSESAEISISTAFLNARTSGRMGPMSATAFLCWGGASTTTSAAARWKPVSRWRYRVQEGSDQVREYGSGETCTSVYLCVGITHILSMK